MYTVWPLLHNAIPQAQSHLQGDISEGVLSPVDISEDKSSHERMQSGVGASTSSKSLWGEYLQVAFLQTFFAS